MNSYALNVSNVVKQAAVTTRYEHCKIYVLWRTRKN